MTTEDKKAARSAQRKTSGPRKYWKRPMILLLRQLYISIVKPDLVRHPVPFLIPAFAGITALTYIVDGAINAHLLVGDEEKSGRILHTIEDVTGRRVPKKEGK